MNLECVRCNDKFEEPVFVGYCPKCVALFRGDRKKAHAAANPLPGVHLCGKFLDPKECPETVADPVTGNTVCGLCGGDNLDQGYGFAGGYGLGMYMFCEDCHAFLDFCEDSGE
jgi:hypothetical protein